MSLCLAPFYTLPDNVKLYFLSREQKISIYRVAFIVPKDIFEKKFTNTVDNSQLAGKTYSNLGIFSDFKVFDEIAYALLSKYENGFPCFGVVNSIELFEEGIKTEYNNMYQFIAQANCIRSEINDKYNLEKTIYQCHICGKYDDSKSDCECDSDLDI